ncbi:MAG: DUF3291 domain-containing protein [Acidimicrobiia bacterium]
MGWHLAQINVGRLRAPLDAEEMAEFVAALGPVNELAEASDGFVWRLTDEDGASSSYVRIPQVDDPLVAVNYSIWCDLDALKAFVYRSGHAPFLRRRRAWFEAPAEAITACWWVPAGDIPSLAEAYDRLLHLRAHGPTERAWTFARPFPAPAD